jgi:hypothetical protein
MVATSDYLYSLLLAGAASAIDDPVVTRDAPRPPTGKIAAE